LACLLSCEARNGARSPFLALGKVGLLAAPGGVGKTQALLQLAIAVASGRPWLGRYHVEAPGPVLLLAAEEDGGELWRRCRRVVERLDLTAAERDALARRLQVAPLHGSGTPLTLLENLAPYGPVRLERSAMWERIAAQLKARGPEPWRLVVLDPAARWMPPDAEKDSKVATTFVEAVEQLAQLAPEGAAPAVLVAHHTNKAALTGQTDQGAARGSSALTDGVRWQANLDRVVVENVLLPGHARLRLVKCNYAPAQAFDPLELSFTEGGVLVPADFAAEQEPKQPKQQKRAKLTAKSGHDKAAGGDNENTW
jgi:RecA-family ATPase